MLENLSWRRTILRRKVNSLSPTALLPTEILTKILRLTCQLEHGLGVSEESGRTTHYTDLLWRNLQILARNCMVHTLLRNMISLLSRKAHGFQVQLLRDWLLRANSLPPFTKLTFCDEHESISFSVCAIMTRSTYWKSFNCLLHLQCHGILENNHFQC